MMKSQVALHILRKTQNIRRVDVHLHTLFSDGQLAVADLLSHCHKANMKVVAITDHDTVNGVLQLHSFCDNEMAVIGGVELSAYSETEPQIHLTGYFPKTTDFSSLQNRLGERIRSIR